MCEHEEQEIVICLCCGKRYCAKCLAEHEAEKGIKEGEGGEETDAGGKD